MAKIHPEKIWQYLIYTQLFIVDEKEKRSYILAYTYQTQKFNVIDYGTLKIHKKWRAYIFEKKNSEKILSFFVFNKSK